MKKLSRKYRPYVKYHETTNIDLTCINMSVHTSQRLCSL